MHVKKEVACRHPMGAAVPSFLRAGEGSYLRCMVRAGSSSRVFNKSCKYSGATAGAEKSVQRGGREWTRNMKDTQARKYKEAVTGTR